MKRKGFTLIELLAVIVILAIIALIATPIIINIIEDAREESEERSVELYASAVKNAIAAYQLRGTSAPTKFSDLTVEYDGDVECATEELYSDGTFYIAGCKVNDNPVDYTYGTQQVTQIYKPQYYSWVDYGFTGEDLPSDKVETASDLNINYPFYLGLDVGSDEKVSAAYVCFTRNETEYCLKGNDTAAYETNKTVLEDAFKDVENACSFGDDSDCGADGLSALVYSSGDVYAYDAGAACSVGGGGFDCCEL